MKCFTRYASICEQAEMSAVPTEKHLYIMSKPHEVLPVDADQQLINMPPPNDSDQTRAELMELQKRLETVKDNQQMMEKWDIDLLVPFVDYLKSNNLTYSQAILDKIINASTVVLLKQKYLFNRPRPGALAKHLGIPLSPLKSSTADTPAYPSGHSTQSRLVALYLSGLHRSHSARFLELAEECGQSRLNAALHYPSDHKGGIEMANRLYVSMSINELNLIKYKDFPDLRLSRKTQ